MALSVGPTLKPAKLLGNNGFPGPLSWIGWKVDSSSSSSSKSASKLPMLAKLPLRELRRLLGAAPPVVEPARDMDRARGPRPRRTARGTFEELKEWVDVNEGARFAVVAVELEPGAGDDNEGCDMDEERCMTEGKRAV